MSPWSSTKGSPLTPGTAISIAAASWRTYNTKRIGDTGESATPTWWLVNLGLLVLLGRAINHHSSISHPCKSMKVMQAFVSELFREYVDFLIWLFDHSLALVLTSPLCKRVFHMRYVSSLHALRLEQPNLPPGVFFVMVRISRYSAVHKTLNGPGDAHPTVLQIIRDEGLENT